MDASYYRRLARDIVAQAANVKDREIATRFRRRAEEYLILADALDAQARAPIPTPEPQQRPAQQQQQVQPPESEDKE
jgi:hypothetical protein